MELKQHPLIREHWPPEPGGAFSRGTEFPLEGQDVLESVLYFAPVHGAAASIALKTRHGSHTHTRDLLLDDAQLAERLAGFLRTQIGKRISEIGEAVLPF
jgi:hypothetical protein